MLLGFPKAQEILPTIKSLNQIGRFRICSIPRLLLLFFLSYILMKQLNNHTLMDSYYLPAFYLYYLPAPYFDPCFTQLGSLSPPLAYPQESLTGQPLEKLEGLQVESQDKSQILQLRKRQIKKISKKKQCRVHGAKTQQNGLQFSQRQQTLNRNLRSNTLKVYFKQLRDPKTETSLNIYKIIEENKIGMTHHKFIKRINSLFPPNSTYISFDELKKKLDSNNDDQSQISFRKVLRISLWRFFRYEIFSVNFKSARTTRKIRNQQIKQGKAILRDLTQ